jgi:hypothetical protein
MNQHVTAIDPLLGAIARAFAAASGKWKGCDWSTQFGRSRLDLNGLGPSQAQLMARATSGSEAADWRAAVAWLAEVQQDARQAESEARTALQLVQCGRLDEALQHAVEACTIESRHHKSLIWKTLRTAIEAALPVPGA